MVIEVPSKNWHLAVVNVIAVHKAHSLNGYGLSSHLRPHEAYATALCNSIPRAELEWPFATHCISKTFAVAGQSAQLVTVHASGVSTAAHPSSACGLCLIQACYVPQQAEQLSFIWLLVWAQVQTFYSLHCTM